MMELIKKQKEAIKNLVADVTKTVEEKIAILEKNIKKFEEANCYNDTLRFMNDMVDRLIEESKGREYVILRYAEKSGSEEWANKVREKIEVQMVNEHQEVKEIAGEQCTVVAKVYEVQEAEEVVKTLIGEVVEYGDEGKYLDAVDSIGNIILGYGCGETIEDNVEKIKAWHSDKKVALEWFGVRHEEFFTNICVGSMSLGDKWLDSA